MLIKHHAFATRICRYPRHIKKWFGIFKKMCISLHNLYAILLLFQITCNFRKKSFVGCTMNDNLMIAAWWLPDIATWWLTDDCLTTPKWLPVLLIYYFSFQKDDITICFWLLHLHQMSWTEFIYFWKLLKAFGSFWKMAVCHLLDLETKTFNLAS